MFNNHFFPRLVKKVKACEFMDLVQDDLMVGEYAAKITQLAKMWPMIYPKSLNRTLSTHHVLESSRRKKCKWSIN
jgi:hypothetical protein